MLYFFVHVFYQCKIFFYETKDTRNLKRQKSRNQLGYLGGNIWSQCQLKGFDITSQLWVEEIEDEFEDFNNKHYPCCSNEIFSSNTYFYKKADDEEILLKLCSDDKMNTMWHDGGDFLFFIKKKDLDELNFENVTCFIESG